MVFKIAFGGKMGVGKDIAADYLLSKYTGQKIIFAEPIYDILRYAQQKCNFSLEKDRQFLQFIGTDWARNKNPNIWIDLLIKNTPQNQNIFLSDLRFSNEFTKLKENGWTCVKILRNHIPDREGSGSKNHSSEVELDTINNSQWDFIIHNNKEKSHLHNILDEIIDQIIDENGKLL